jgi:dihydrofolate reductase
MIIMIAAASENNALGKTMNWFGVYNDFKGSKSHFRTSSYIMGRKHSKVFHH